MGIFTVSVIFGLVACAFGQGPETGSSGVAVQDLSGQGGTVPDLSTVLNSMGVSGSSSSSAGAPESSLLPAIDGFLSPPASVGGTGEPFGPGLSSRDPGGFVAGPTDLRLDARPGTDLRGSTGFGTRAGAPLDSGLPPRDPRLTADPRDPRLAADPRDPRFARTDMRDPRLMLDPRDPRLTLDPRFPIDPRDPRASMAARDMRGSRLPTDPLSFDPRFVDPRDPRYDPRALPAGLDRRPLMGFDSMGRPIFMDGGFGVPPMDPRLSGSVPDPRLSAGSAADRRFGGAGAAGASAGSLVPGSSLGGPLPAGAGASAGLGGLNGSFAGVDTRGSFDARRLAPVDPRFGPRGPIVDPRFAGLPPYTGFPVSPYPPFFGSRFGPSVAPGFLGPPTFVPSGTSRFLTGGVPPGFASSVGPTFGGPVDFPTGTSSLGSPGFGPTSAGMGAASGRLSSFSPSAAGRFGATAGGAIPATGSFGSFSGAGASVPLTSGSSGLTGSVSGSASGVGLP